MPFDNVARIKQMYDTFQATGDLESVLRDFFNPAVVWIDDVTHKGRLTGHQGFLDAMASLAAEGYEPEAQPESFEAIDEDTVIASGYTRLKQGDAYIDLPSHSVFVLRNGQVVRGAGSVKRKDALEAATTA